MSFENKLAIVTGSYQGLGKGIAKKLASQGCNLILVDIDDNLCQTKDELLQYGTKVEFYIGDVSDEKTAKSVMEIATDKFNQLDILVNNAGIGGMNKKLWELPTDEFDRVYSINLKGVFLCSQEVLKFMPRGGKIINIDSSLIAEEPKILTHADAMKENISQALGIEVEQIGIKATTNERMGFVGKGEGMAAMAVASVEV